MKILTSSQIEFLKTTIFLTGHDHPGVPEIAHHLLEHGRCTVAGDGRLWSGGVGNFIDLSEAPDAVGCTTLTLDLDAFLSSLWIKEHIADAVDQLATKIENLNCNLQDLKDL